MLCHYKVGLLEEDLAARFRISQGLVSRIIVTWTKFMYYRFKELDIFPDRQIIELYKPPCFKNKYKETTVIIDATEIYIEKPTNPEAQQLTFSTYKNTNTLKALVGITPSGQFTEQEMLATQRIATLRIHVECAIEHIKNYHILDFIPTALCKSDLIDTIFFVCATLTNFLPPLVK